MPGIGEVVYHAKVENALRGIARQKTLPLHTREESVKLMERYGQLLYKGRTILFLLS
ncbi:hypothetical protein J8TS2_05430 [Lederbergia ruris]|uniref:Uncharacterized protein n=1 Tax=Lederbergia ruris TaxID=217495 RepID=A0ABQ4KE29_9BACI|nr:hypothetical protein J8TS2_05430 [Lederbergia ruris]